MLFMNKYYLHVKIGEAHQAYVPLIKKDNLSSARAAFLRLRPGIVKRRLLDLVTRPQCRRRYRLFRRLGDFNWYSG